MKGFKKGGIHPKENKLTANNAVERMPNTGAVTLMLSQAIGAPSKPVVKPGDEVKAGQLVAEAGGFVGAPIHSPINGTVKAIAQVSDAQGYRKDAITIEPAAEAEEPQGKARTEEEIRALTPKEIIAIVGDAGIVGMGGATFPTRVKLSVPEGKHAEVVIINGAECEPWLTCDDRLMRETPERIVEGTRLIMAATGAPKGVIGIEENKPEAIAAMEKAAEGHDDIEVCVLRTKYPQGGEKQLIAAITGREVPDGGLPIDVGAIVDNVATAAAVCDAVKSGLPVTRRVVTVTGPSVKKPGNYLIDFGTPISRVLEMAGGLPEDTGKVIGGGPMMGRSISNLDAPTTKGMNGILVLPRDMSLRKTALPCIRCAKCVAVCPMGLEPYLMMTLAEFGEYETMKERHVLSCIECGSCSWVCPSSRPLLDYIKLGKGELRRKK